MLARNEDITLRKIVKEIDDETVMDAVKLKNIKYRLIGLLIIIVRDYGILYMYPFLKQWNTIAIIRSNNYFKRKFTLITINKRI